MSCLTPEQLAAVASGQPTTVAASELDHAEACLACRRQLAEQRALRALVARVAAPALTRDRRAQLAAEVMARADGKGRRTRRTRRSVVAAATAAGVMLALVTGERIVTPPPTELATAPRTPDPPLASRPAAAGPATRPQRRADRPEPPAVQAAVSGARARFTRGNTGGRDIVDLRDGEITVDARTTAPVEVALGPTGVRVAAARVSVVARRGVIESVTVFAGSAQVTAGGRDHQVQAGTVWHRDTLADRGHAIRDTLRATPVAPPEPPDARAAITAFRDGWEALRQDRYAEAIAAFDRASDPVVAEDAAYWAAIAAERGGDHAAAIRRLTEFVARFPDSSRAATARDARDQLHD